MVPWKGITAVAIWEIFIIMKVYKTWKTTQAPHITEQLRWLDNQTSVLMSVVLYQLKLLQGFSRVPVNFHSPETPVT